MEKQIIIHANNHRLHSVLHMPQGGREENFPVVVICHGFIGSKVGQHRIFVKAAREFYRAGFAVLRFDFSGCGESTGEYRDVTLTEQVEQAIKAIDFVSAYPGIDAERIILLGHSLGGGIAATVAGLDQRVKKLILWSPVANPFDDIISIVGSELYEDCLRDGVVNYQGFELGWGLFASLLQVHPLETVKNFPNDVLVVHGGNDIETPVQNARLYESVLSQRPYGSQDVKIIDGADHTYNSSVWESTIIDWTRQWLVA